MMIKKLKYILIAAVSIIISVQSKTQCMQECRDEIFIIESQKLLKDFNFVRKYDHQYFEIGAVSQPMQQTPLPLIEGFAEDLCTVLLETSTSKGTGFIGSIDERAPDAKMYYPPYNYSGPTIPFLFTNKHVIQKKEVKEGCYVDLEDQDHITMTLRFIRHNEQYTNLKELDFKAARIKISYRNLKKYIIVDDENVDVVAICLHDLFDTLYTQADELKGFLPYYYGIDMKIAFDQKLKGFETGSEVFLFGYPQGIYDEINYLPIGRFGHCSCNPQVLKERFLVDIASFPGQSGAPVFFKKESLMFLGLQTNANNIINKSNTTNSIQKNLVGIFTAGPIDKCTGSPIHLGEVIKIDRLEKLINKYWDSKGSQIIYSKSISFNDLLFNPQFLHSMSEEVFHASRSHENKGSKKF